MSLASHCKFRPPFLFGWCAHVCLVLVWCKRDAMPHNCVFCNNPHLHTSTLSAPPHPQAWRKRDAGVCRLRSLQASSHAQVSAIFSSSERSLRARLDEAIHALADAQAESAMSAAVAEAALEDMQQKEAGARRHAQAVESELCAVRIELEEHAEKLRGGSAYLAQMETGACVHVCLCLCLCVGGGCVGALALCVSGFWLLVSGGGYWYPVVTVIIQWWLLVYGSGCADFLTVALEERPWPTHLTHPSHMYVVHTSCRPHQSWLWRAGNWRSVPGWRLSCRWRACI